MENNLKNATEWLDTNEHKFPKVFKSKHFLIRILIDYANSVYQPTQREELIKFATRLFLYNYQDPSDEEIEEYVDYYLKEKE